MSNGQVLSDSKYTTLGGETSWHIVKQQTMDSDGKAFWEQDRGENQGMCACLVVTDRDGDRKGNKYVALLCFTPL